MDIRGIGNSLSATLFEHGLIKDVADLYCLKEKREQLLKLEGMGEKSADNVLDTIEKNKDRPLSRLIFALGIRHVGAEMAGVLAQKFNDLDALALATREELMSIDTVGPKIADSIINFFQQEDNRRIIDRLKESEVNFKAETAKPEELPLAGQEFVITGRLETLSRQEAGARVKTLGGTVKDKVTRNTTYLVVGEEPGAGKLKQADRLNTERLTEAAFVRKIGER